MNNIGKHSPLSACLIVLFFIPLSVLSQDWRSPIDHELRLSGTFCELRTNHFHHGIDIKSSKGVSGDPIYAIEDGFIHRLRVQAAGYGNSIYIKHPNGYVSVYGHLQKMSPDLDSMVKSYQYQDQTFEIDMHCDSLLIPVKKGDLIGHMGTSGYSFGPHLHFEIRDAKTEATINPLLMGFLIKDDIAPSFRQVRLDYLSPEGRKYHETTHQLITAKSKSTVVGDTIRIGAWRCGLALRTQDRMNSTNNRNGIYEIQIKVDSQLIYQFRGDSVHFFESRGVNLLKDVDAFKQRKERWYLAYSQPGNPLEDHLLMSLKNGWIETFANKVRRIEVTIGDLNGNENNLLFYLLRDENMVEQNFPAHNYKLNYHEPNIIRIDSVELYCPEGVFYRDQFINVDLLPEKTTGRLSHVISFHGETTPFHQACTLRIKPHACDSSLLDRVVVLSCGNTKDFNLGGERIESRIECPIYSFQEYVLHVDTLAPVFEVMSFPKSMNNGAKVKFKIYDERESKGTAREVSCHVEIDGLWSLLVHDVKSNTFTARIEGLDPGEHVFVMKYWDHAGNEKTWEKIFRINK